MTARRMQLVAAFCTCVASTLSAQDSLGARRLVKLREEYPCVHRSIKIVRINEAAPGEPCALAEYAFHLVAAGRARSVGVEPIDTAKIAVIAVTAFHVRRKETGNLDHSYWTLSTWLEGGKRGVEFYLDMPSGRVTVAHPEGSMSDLFRGAKPRGG